MKDASRGGRPHPPDGWDPPKVRATASGRRSSSEPTKSAAESVIAVDSIILVHAHRRDRIAAICADHGVRELWTADRNFSSVPLVHVSNPLVDPSS
jgi:hypothetical protein